MAAERYGNFFGLRNRLGTRHKHLKWALVDRAHEFVIEFACTCGRVDRLNVVANFGRTTDVQFPPASLPKQELHDAFYVEKRGCEMASRWREDRRAERRNGAVATLQCQPKRQASGSWDQFAVFPREQGNWAGNRV